MSELAVVLYSVSKDPHISKNVKDKKKIQVCCFLFAQAFILWQLLVFVQITVGTMSIPLLLLTFVSLLCVLVSIVQIINTDLHMLIVILASIPYPCFKLKGACLSSHTITVLHNSFCLLCIQFRRVNR